MNDPSQSPIALDPATVAALHPAVAVLDPEATPDARLPADHPQWQRDVVSISTRARTIIATIVPVVVRTLCYWDHRLRELALGTRTLSVDPAGCYRLR